MYITAHSMGGLVARSFIVNYGGKFPCVKLFVSLATPWGGDRMAEYGVRQSPVVIPSWLDMQPDGEFITSLYRQNLPDSVSFYMFYGYRGNRNPFSANNDGTITLSSLLDYRPQSEARMNYAFHEDHTSILTSKEVVEQFNAVLEASAEEQSASLHRSGGYLKIDFAYDYALDGLRPRPTLILRPADKETAETVIFLNHDDNGRILGPFPAGDYLASMISQAGKPRKKYVPVSLASNETEELDFLFTPDGVIRGCVTASLKPEDKSVGMPDYRYRSEDEKIDIQSVTLTGDGIYRSLEPRWGEEINDNEYLIRRNDFCYNTCFGFFGLPAGDYTLVLHAHGYKPIVKDYSVVPGILNYFRITELTAD